MISVRLLIEFATQLLLPTADRRLPTGCKDQTTYD
jgi:hypothetical protein